MTRSMEFSIDLFFYIHGFTMQIPQKLPLGAIIGLGNPGAKFARTRHNIGFMVVDALVNILHGSWQSKELMEIALVTIHDKSLVVIKPQTYMNSSGKVIPYLLKKGMHAENILVIHDELELPFGKLKIRMGGSAKGHNGLRSIIEHCGGNQFPRLCIGIDRPDQKEQVPEYVLHNFCEPAHELELVIEQAVNLIESLV
jgi:peptidyl-tRNA hydrolase, PTH1 family